MGLALLSAFGCRQGFFAATGYVQSEGGVLGTWRSTPQGCTRDSLDGLPPDQTRTIATFLWQDPSVHDLNRDQDRPTAPDAPMRLELMRAGTGYSAAFTTVRKPGVEATGAACSQFAVETHEGAPQVAGALPSLGGRVRFQCDVAGGHVQADLAFTRCEF